MTYANYPEDMSNIEKHSILASESLSRLETAIDQQIADEDLVIRAAEQVLGELVLFNAARFPDQQAE